ncbi:MAG: FAD-binding protein [Clostridia bacterium]|nr:FAD-binding protein [Clostridia bacterium]
MKKFMAMLLCAMMLLCSVCGAMADGITTTMTVEWDGAYDVVVIGFGGAGAIAAKNAAEAGAKVLIVEKAPEGSEGGNTRFCGQMFVYGKGNVEATREYYKALGGSRDIPEGIFNVYTEKIANMAEIVAEETGLDPANFGDAKAISTAVIAYSPEYPEFPGAESIELWATHQDGISDGYLWTKLRQNVVDNSENIDVWFESPAKHLIQEPTTGTILGVQVERGGELLNIKANNGVVMALGGFENSQEKVETYLGLSKVAVQGSLYNTGDGIDMALEVGADLWHMNVWEGMGAALGATTVYPGDGKQVSYYTSYMPPCTSGSVMMVAGDGARFINETEYTRHGHIKHHDAWENPHYPQSMYLVMSNENYQTALAYQVAVPADGSYTYSGNTVEELAAAIGVDAATLADTFTKFNSYAETGMDVEFGRNAESMKAFPAEGPYYAVELVPQMLNTQGGAKRNENAEVLNTEGNPIPHLYSAGEFGGICSLHYQGGGNIAEVIIFGQLAGQNAAAAKEALPEGLVTDVMTDAKYTPGVMTDIVVADYSHIELGENEYLGIGEGGMGGVVVCKVKIVDGKIEEIEVVEHAETAGISDPAIANMPGKIIEAQSVEVDNVSGATLTSTAIKNAVADAMSKAK